MYAVIKTGGKQYRVSEGDFLKIEKLDVEQGETINFEEVLMVANGDDFKIGAPLVEGGKVTAIIESHGRGDKVEILKFKRRKHHMKKMGHRQSYTKIKVTGISAG